MQETQQQYYGCVVRCKRHHRIKVVLFIFGKFTTMEFAVWMFIFCLSGVVCALCYENSVFLAIDENKLCWVIILGSIFCAVVRLAWEIPPSYDLNLLILNIFQKNEFKKCTPLKSYVKSRGTDCKNSYNSYILHRISIADLVRLGRTGSNSAEFGQSDLSELVGFGWILIFG